MPRVSRGPHLYLKQRPDDEATWYIRDGRARISTGCHERDPGGAGAALQEHIGRTAEPELGNGDPSRVDVAAIIALYAIDIAPGLARPQEASTRLLRLNEWWGQMKVVDVSPSNCAAYARWRMHAGHPGKNEPERRARAVSGPSARRELADLQSALNHA